MKSKVHLFKKRKTFEVGPVVGNGPIFQYYLHLLKQYILGDVAQETIMFEPLGSCVYLQSFGFKVLILFRGMPVTLPR